MSSVWLGFLIHGFCTLRCKAKSYTTSQCWNEKIQISHLFTMMAPSLGTVTAWKVPAYNFVPSFILCDFFSALVFLFLQAFLKQLWFFACIMPLSKSWHYVVLFNIYIERDTYISLSVYRYTHNSFFSFSQASWIVCCCPVLGIHCFGFPLHTLAFW